MHSVDFVGELLRVILDRLAVEDLLGKVADARQQDWVGVVVRQNLQKLLDKRLLQQLLSVWCLSV